MAETMKVEVVTAEGMVYSESAEMVTLQCIEGRMRIGPHHTPVIAELAPGEMVVQIGGRRKQLALGEGLVLVSSNLAVVITDLADADCSKRH